MPRGINFFYAYFVYTVCKARVGPEYDVQDQDVQDDLDSSRLRS